MSKKKKKYQCIVNLYHNQQKACLIRHQLIKYVEKKYSRRVTINKIYKMTQVEELYGVDLHPQTKLILNSKYQFTISIHSTDDSKAEIIYNQLKDYTFRTYKQIRINKLYKMIDIKKEREEEQKEIEKRAERIRLIQENAIKKEPKKRKERKKRKKTITIPIIEEKCHNKFMNQD